MADNTTICLIVTLLFVRLIHYFSLSAVKRSTHGYFEDVFVWAKFVSTNQHPSFTRIGAFINFVFSSKCVDNIGINLA